MRRVLYLWVPHLHTAVERLLAPELAEEPVVVVAGSFARGRVVDASPEAEALGAGVGQSWRHARRHAPTAVFIPYEAMRYGPFTERIGGLLHERTPWVETLPGSEEEFFAELGAGSLEEGELLARGAIDAVRGTLGLEARAGLATGKLVARTAGRFGSGVGSWELGVREEPSLAPNSQLLTPVSIIPPGQERQFLKPLSLDYLWDMQPEHRRRLGPLGLRTFGQLAAVPQRLLIGQFGPVGRWYRLLAAGIDARRVKPWNPYPTVSSRLLIEEEPGARSAATPGAEGWSMPLLEGYLELLARRVSDTLISTGQYARVVSLLVETDGSRPFAARHLKAPTNLPEPIRRAARELLQKASGVRRQALVKSGHSGIHRFCPHPPTPSPNSGRGGASSAFVTDSRPPFLQALTLIASGLETRGVLQLSLFGEAEREAALRAAIAWIQDRFGEAAIGTAAAVASGQWSVVSKNIPKRRRRP